MDMGWWQVLLGLFGCGATATITIFRVAWIVRGMLADMKAEFNALLELKDKEIALKIGKIYERFDDYKDHMENGFTRKEVCAITHSSQALAVSELSHRIALAEEKSEKRMDSIEAKIDSLILRVSK